MTWWVRLKAHAVLAIAGLAAAVLLLAAAYFMGVRQGRTECTADTATEALATTVKGVKAGKAKTASDIKRAGSTGAARERDRAAIDDFFSTLAREADDDPTDARRPGAGACELSPAGLRRWSAANAGPFADGTGAGAAAGQPADPAAPAAAASIGAVGRPGGESPGGDAPLPPAGEPALPAAGVPAGAGFRLPALSTPLQATEQPQ